MIRHVSTDNPGEKALNAKAAERRRAAFRSFLDKHEIQPKTLADAARVSPNTLYGFLNKRSGSLSQDVVERLLLAARLLTRDDTISEVELFGGGARHPFGVGRPGNPESRTDFVPAPIPQSADGAMPQDLPVYGTAAASVQGAFQLHESVIVDRVRRPPSLAGAPDAYAIYTQGDSMAPMVKPGDLRFVHPHRPTQPGDLVVVQIRNGEHEAVISYLKILKRRTESTLYLEQLNPARVIEIPVEGKDVKIHKVLDWNDIFGV